MTTNRFAQFAPSALAMMLVSAMPVLAGQRDVPTPARIDPRWAPWLGCWQLVDETVQDSPSLAEALAALGRSRANSRVLVCVTPAMENAATMTTLVDDTPVLTETIVADGASKPLTEPDCRGWQRAEWSTLGPRLFAQAELTCADQAPRTVSGLAVLVAGPVWVDVQLIESQGRKSLRIRRYLSTRRQPEARRTIDAVGSPSREHAARFEAHDCRRERSKRQGGA